MEVPVINRLCCSYVLLVNDVTRQWRSHLYDGLTAQMKISSIPRKALSYDRHTLRAAVFWEERLGAVQSVTRAYQLSYLLYR
jgi:hypothetical protein